MESDTCKVTVEPGIVTTAPHRQQHGLVALTARERHVAALMAEGRSDAAISPPLVVSGGAVEKHVASSFDKLGLPSDEADDRRVLGVLRY